jgi:hypothetical protein
MFVECVLILLTKSVCVCVCFSIPLFFDQIFALSRTHFIAGKKKAVSEEDRLG